ncbi:uncharacterized protein [Brachyistius frenatus]|uniref:uncharacterized protein n=1 Tax=Brachyistius frenatus TaxID=100188 RepID=UPI0037E70E10
MKTFPQYDGSDATESQWGRRNADTALKKEADWIPFIRVKPRRDPWQQKILTELKERSSVDELMKAHCRFLQESDLLHVAADLKHQTSPPVGVLSSSSVSRSRKNKRQAVSEIWIRLYSAQETMRRSSRSRGSDGERPTSTDGSSSLGDRLEHSLETGSADPGSGGQYGGRPIRSSQNQRSSPVPRVPAAPGFTSVFPPSCFAFAALL